MNVQELAKFDLKTCVEAQVLRCPPEYNGLTEATYNAVNDYLMSLPKENVPPSQSDDFQSHIAQLIKNAWVVYDTRTPYLRQGLINLDPNTASHAQGLLIFFNTDDALRFNLIKQASKLEYADPLEISALVEGGKYIRTPPPMFKQKIKRPINEAETKWKELKEKILSWHSELNNNSEVCDVNGMLAEDVIYLARCVNELDRSASLIDIAIEHTLRKTGLSVSLDEDIRVKRQVYADAVYSIIPEIEGAFSDICDSCKSECRKTTDALLQELMQYIEDVMRKLE